jgi:hypothetical protein
MEMAEIKTTQVGIVAAIDRLGQRTEPNDSSFHIKRCDSIEEFDQLEKKLADKSEFELMVMSFFVFSKLL